MLHKSICLKSASLECDGVESSCFDILQTRVGRLCFIVQRSDVRQALPWKRHCPADQRPDIGEIQRVRICPEAHHLTGPNRGAGASFVASYPWPEKPGSNSSRCGQWNQTWGFTKCLGFCYIQNHSFENPRMSAGIRWIRQCKSCNESVGRKPRVEDLVI